MSRNIISPLAAFYQREQQQSDDICFVQPYADGQIEQLSWQQVGQQVRSMAAYLRSLDLPKGSRIALLSNNCAHWIMADLAIWMAGHVSVPLYPVLTASSIRQIIEHSEAELIFVGKLLDWPLMEQGVPEHVPIISLPICPSELNAKEQWKDIVTRTAPMLESPDVLMEDLATLIYTSGTTGEPKGVMHSFENIAMTGTLSSEFYETSTSDRMLSYLPLAHVAERAAVEIGMLYRGFRVYFANSLETFADDLRRARPTLFFAVPRIWIKLRQRVLEKVPADKLDRLLSIPLVSRFVRRRLSSALGMDAVRIGLSGAAPLSTSVLAWYQRLGISILEGYAMSENFAYSHTSRLGEAVIGSVGCANPMVDCKISAEGEVLVKSPTNMMGYFKEPEKSREAFDEDGYLRTGDKGEIDEQGRLTLTGRIKEIFKTSKGKYVAPAPIEDRLMHNQLIELVCVTGADLPQPIALLQLTEAVLARLSSRDNRAKAEIETQLQDTLLFTNQQLDKHETLNCLVVVDEPWSIDNGIITPTLKIKRERVEARYKDRFETWYSDAKNIIWLDGNSEGR